MSKFWRWWSTLSVLVCSAGWGASALAQENPEAATTETVVENEIVVRGRSFGVLREAIREAEVAVYDRFNQINSDDQFDIHCRWDVVTGSKMRHWLCEPNFWREAEAHIGEETARAMQGSFAFPVQQYRSEQHFKRQLLQGEMQRLIDEDEEYRAALSNLGRLHQALSERRVSERMRKLTRSREVDPDGESLPYEADVMVEVRVGRQPWFHELQSRTFTMAQVFGEIRRVEVECSEHTQRLEYEIGVEWTLPDDWGACTVRVDASRDTTFALYEFQ